MKPEKVFLFILLCMLSLFATSKVSNFVLKDILKSKEVMLPDPFEKINEKPDSTEYFAKLKKQEETLLIQKTKDSILRKPSRSFADTLALLEVESLGSAAKFYFANDDRSVMDLFFDELKKVKQDNTFFRIIHYGDSQIEMDRISSYLREQLQKKYGGAGMGLLPTLEVTPKYTVAVQSVGTWTRKLTFGSKEFRASHNKYGPMAYFCKKESNVASVVYTARENTTFKNRNFNRCRVLLGPVSQSLSVDVSYNGEIKDSKTIQASDIEQLIVFKTDSCNGKIGLKFSGANADILGVSLDHQSGISLDNVPMRGGSGTVFRKINFDNLKRSYQLMGVKMVILQFGGNALPGMTSKSSAESYGNKFYEEIKYLKLVDPNLIVFVIGPADMSIKENGNLVTHPQLENVRDALKSATLRAGGVFWDMYEAMGGNGSMIKWVKSKPALGSPDYIHFSQKGAEKIANIFYQSLMKEFEMYELRKKIEQ
jgi:hypothetical protein